MLRILETRFTIVLLVLLQIVGLTLALYETCNHALNLAAGGQVIVNSPNYPNRYPTGSSCKYVITAPTDYTLKMVCSISMDVVPPSNSCTIEQFLVSTEGMNDLSRSETFCGTMTLTRSSIFNKLSFGYANFRTSSKGAFTCKITAELLTCDCGWTVSSRIQGGEIAAVNEFPPTVGLVNSVNIFCGGAIISDRYVLTAASCIASINPSTIKVIVGEADIMTGTETPYTQVYSVLKTKTHPAFSTQTMQNDIGLVNTVNTIQWYRGVGPACLPYAQQNVDFAGVSVIANGWGSTVFAGPTSTKLKKASLKVTTKSACQSQYSGLVNSQMCAYSSVAGTCTMDNGGPLYYISSRLILVGIISKPSCPHAYPSLNTRVASFLPWIGTETGANFCVKA